MTSIPRAGEASARRRWQFGTYPWLEHAPKVKHRPRVIIDNDFSGDPDDLYQLVHHVLSPAVEIRAVIGSHLSPGDVHDSGPNTAANAVLVAEDILDRMGAEHHGLVFAGAPEALADRGSPRSSRAVDAIVAEAMRDDVDTPLFFAAGAGLTDLASALLVEPRIVDRVTLVWIGGLEHADLAVPPLGAMPIEYNLLIDVLAGQVVFDSGMDIWQVPRNVYRQCLVSEIELRSRVRNAGPLGRHIYDETRKVMDMAAETTPPADTYALGDSPLVLLTALRSTFQADATSSDCVLRPTPMLTSDGSYRAVAGRRAMRIYTQVDTRLMFEDMYLKLGEFSRWQAADQ
jgi:purine nucleosidase